MSSSCGSGTDRADDTLGDRLASEQSFWHRRDRRVRMLNGEIVMRKAPLAVIGGTLVVLVFLACVGCVANGVVVMTIGVVVIVRPSALAVVARVV